MITIQFNNQSLELEKNCSLNNMLTSLGYIDTNFAIAVNRKFIHKTDYPNYILQMGDHIEVITPMQGG